MGLCQSCLGQRDGDELEESEENRLLYEDGNALQYGSFGDAGLSGDETVEAQRENEALQRVVAKTTNNMVDVFEVGPERSVRRPSYNVFNYVGHGVRAARYQHLVSRLDSEQGGSSSNNFAGAKVEWLSDENNLPRTKHRPATIKTVRANHGDALVGTFADAAAAMEV